MWLVTAGIAACVAAGLVTGRWWPRVSYSSRAAAQLAPTAHPPLPSRIEDAWLVPSDKERQRIAARPGVKTLRAAATAIRSGRFDEGAAALDGTRLDGTPLEPYVEYYRALVDLRLRRPAPARTRLSALRRSLSAGRLRQLALSAEAEAALSLDDAAGAAALLEELYPLLTKNRDVVLDQWATAARAAGRPQDATRLWLRLYYEFPTSDLAPGALRQAETTMQGAAVGTPDAFPHDLTRAEALLAAGRAADAEAALKQLEALLPASADAADAQARRDRIQLRLAQAACAQRRCGFALTALTDLASRGVGAGEAQYLLASALRDEGQAGPYREAIESLAAIAPGSPADPWVERALNEYGTYLVKMDADADAAAIFRRLFDRHPSGRYAERAAWKYGWSSYRGRQFDEAIRVFELAASTIPRANTRPAWLYWAGRSREQRKDVDGATRVLTLAALDYFHSYYGRIASEALTRLGAPVPSDRAAVVPGIVLAAVDGGDRDASPDDVQETRADDATMVATEPPPSADLITWLVSAGMFDEAIEEMQHAQRAHGRTPKLDATLAWVYRQQGEIRPAINTMRRAYPQYLSVEGDALPREIQEVIFPLEYIQVIKRYAAQHGLDPFVVAALIGQESSYVADVRSPANAWGLMQILPSTGRQLARAEGVRRFRTQMLTDPETNVRLGTRHFAGLVRNLGGVPYALAGYNAGSARVIRWKAERGPLEQAEFIDDIPFPETQIYVKKILGTAVDYRRLYGNVLAE
ncbi:lytic transglycosylase domain-containing protein [Luteitalea pratensis]|uniref:lytic transglycosylase domain-containing protein n=1 Tax=Luteitalea pratensis TaxID=1855912 RepID=UPI0012FFA5A2|nr:lytic transglycosylase domain-containing protein [Luteitalea pratensis]